MEIKLKEITISDLIKDYEDNGDDGVVGYGGKLDIRPPCQREFIYKDDQRKAVIDTVTKNFGNYIQSYTRSITWVWFSSA